MSIPSWIGIFTSGTTRPSPAQRAAICSSRLLGLEVRIVSPLLHPILASVKPDEHHLDLVDRWPGAHSALTSVVLLQNWSKIYFDEVLTVTCVLDQGLVELVS